MTSAHARPIRGPFDARCAESLAYATHFSALATILAARKGFVPCGGARPELRMGKWPAFHRRAKGKFGEIGKIAASAE